MSNITELDNRLLACASFVRHDSIVADIGSDHAYLPIYLVSEGICPRAIASDINKGPVDRARANIALSALSDKIDVLLADGLDKAAGFSPDDVVIAGMGGELIRDIIAASDYARRDGVRLILQPMTMPDALRAYLAAEGFKIVGETVCTAADKYYQVICAEYDGKPYTLKHAQLLFGPLNLARIAKGCATTEDMELLERARLSSRRRICGMERAERPNTDAIASETEIYELCCELIKKSKGE